MKYATSQKKSTSRFVGLFIALLVLFLLPFLVKSPYIMHIIIMTIIGVVLGMTFSMIYSVGRISLGAGAFYAIGAYASALLAMKLGLAFWLALLVPGDRRLRRTCARRFSAKSGTMRASPWLNISAQ